MLVFGVPVVCLAAAQAPLASSHDSSRITRYLIVSGDSSSGSWDSRDDARLKEWRTKYGSHFAWFRQDGRDYIIDDHRTLDEFEEAMGPQREVNRHQDDVNRHQDLVNGQQGKVNRQQDGVNCAQEGVNQQQSLVNQGGGEQSRVNQLQSEVNGKQRAVNAEQDKVNREQSVVNREQDAVNQMQARASVEVERALQAVFDSARRHGLAHEVR
jgi:hypothetical protein